MFGGAGENSSARRSLALPFSANAQDREVPRLDRAADRLRTQNGISSSSGSEGAADFGGAAVALPLERDCRSSSVVSVGPLAPVPLGLLPSTCTVSPSTRRLVRFSPVCLSSQVSICRRPS